MARVFDVMLRLAGNISSSFGSMFQSANDRIRQLNQNSNRLRNEMRELRRSYEQGGMSVREYESRLAALRRELERVEGAQRRYSRALDLQQRVGGMRDQFQAGMIGAAGMALALAAPVKAAMDFESTMADVKKVVDFETPEQYKEMEQDILNMSKRIPMTAEGLAQIVAAGGQAGLAKDELTAYAESAAKMGVAFDMSADEAGQTMAEWRAAFRMNQEEVNTLADQINYLGNTTAASSPKISEVVKRIGPLGEVGGAAASQIAALGATMVGAGVQEEIAATGIKNMILSMVAGESATKSQAEAFQSLGMDAAEMAKMMQDDAQGAIMSVFQSLQKLPKEKQASVMQELFGKESIGAIAPLLTNLDGLVGNLNKVGDASQYAGSMEKEFAARSETTANNLQLLKNQAYVLAINVGSILLPPLSDLAGRLSGLAERVAGFTEKYPGLTRAILIGGAAATGLAIAFTAVGFVLSTLAFPFVSIYAWIQAQNVAAIAAGRLTMAQRLGAAATRIWSAGMAAFSLILRLNPIGLVVVAIAGLIAIGVVLYKNFDKVRETADALWERFKSTFPSAAALVESVGQKVGYLWGKLKGFWRWLTGRGGESGGSGEELPSDAEMEGFARGGFADRPSIFGEAGLEAAIPIDGSARSVSIWQRTGEMLGVGGGNITINATFAPVVNGAGPEIMPELQRQQKSFIEQLQDVIHQERRVKLG